MYLLKGGDKLGEISGVESDVFAGVVSSVDNKVPSAVGTLDMENPVQGVGPWSGDGVGSLVGWPGSGLWDAVHEAPLRQSSYMSTMPYGIAYIQGGEGVCRRE